MTRRCRCDGILLRHGRYLSVRRRLWQCGRGRLNLGHLLASGGCPLDICRRRLWSWLSTCSSGGGRGRDLQQGLHWDGSRGTTNPRRSRPQYRRIAPGESVSQPQSHSPPESHLAPLVLQFLGLLGGSGLETSPAHAQADETGEREDPKPPGDRQPSSSLPPFHQSVEVEVALEESDDHEYKCPAQNRDQDDGQRRDAVAVGVVEPVVAAITIAGCRVGILAAEASGRRSGVPAIVAVPWIVTRGGWAVVSGDGRETGLGELCRVDEGDGLANGGRLERLAVVGDPRRGDRGRLKGRCDIVRRMNRHGGRVCPGGTAAGRGREDGIHEKRRDRYCFRRRRRRDLRTPCRICGQRRIEHLHHGGRASIIVGANDGGRRDRARECRSCGGRNVIDVGIGIPPGMNALFIVLGHNPWRRGNQRGECPKQNNARKRE